MTSLLFQKKKKGHAPDEADHSHSFDNAAAAAAAEKDYDEDSGHGVVPGSQYTSTKKERPGAGKVQLNDGSGGRGWGRACGSRGDDDNDRPSRSVSISRTFQRMVKGGKKTTFCWIKPVVARIKPVLARI